MDDMLNITRWIHGGLGAICLLSGVVALASPKKAGRHPVVGKVFFCVLVCVYVAILPNIISKTNIFMLAIGWLAVYAGAEGWRALLRFKNTLSLQPNLVDYTLNGISLVMSVLLLGLGGWVLVYKTNMMGLALLGFGVLGVVLSKGAYQRWKTPPPRKAWLALHIQMMCGAFAAALTAFFALQLSGSLGSFEWLLWVAPTVMMSLYASREVKARNLETEPGEERAAVGE